MVVMKVVNSLGRGIVANVKITSNGDYLREANLYDTGEFKWSFDPNSPNTSVFYCEVSTNSDWEKSWTVFEPNNEKIQYFGNEIAWFMRGDGIFIGTMLGDELIKVHNW
ncbi:hypothetical protein WR25_06466 isoform G [Diploscapter pachys]|uniref:Uncharacterized protein n=1 Tax=Diploscapter pachys TaxID=2018661 RepID=A0A2A2LF71_9BILA|nr:hypothetical protein WR25_06466 isoform A [Diploscapter pachys]PAV84862.1 hypothetical protein WR25_06466 isoform D [Diploscapter pachys]PAV84863.1 hypothetical protein WR25_06466 isoform E [Diploscapter pachys]PAV84864.1 hypothetical protein WR25_06466 isoform F [Diploscapter pachys]PAV84865.1 hypothetical protein WR25_06466 isoform G [Diploscapter pachys]